MPEIDEAAIMTGNRKRKPAKRKTAAALRTKRINLRASAEQDRMIRDAASATGRTVSDFILDSACRAALDARLDQTIFRLNPAQWKKFVAALDRPAKVKPRLRALMSRPSIFDKE
jgi:uncharacterized protein (DUF1778 family)